MKIAKALKILTGRMGHRVRLNLGGSLAFVLCVLIRAALSSYEFMANDEPRGRGNMGDRASLSVEIFYLMKDLYLGSLI